MTETSLFLKTAFSFEGKLTPQAKIFWGFAALHLFIWTLVPLLCGNNQPLDVIEGYAWGREGLIGTAKHPPMQAWILEILATLTNKAEGASFFASQVCVVTGLWGVWSLGRRMLSEEKALFGVLLLEGVAYTNLTSTEFNPNTLLLAFWPLIALFFMRAVVDNKMRDWLLLGFFAAAGLLSKYATCFLLVPLALCLVTHKTGRKALRAPGLYLSILLGLALCMPHILWLFEHNFQPLAYAESRTNAAASLVEHLLFPLRFSVAQGAALLGLGLLFLSLGAPQKQGKLFVREPFSSFLLTVLCFGPFLILLLSSFFVGIKLHDMWGSALWCWLGLWLAEHFCREDLFPLPRRFLKSLGGVTAAFLGLFLFLQLIGPSLNQAPNRVHFPGSALANEIATAWKRTVRTDLAYVVGDVWLAGNVAYYAKAERPSARPHVFISGDKSLSPWIDSQDFARQGGVLVWCEDRCTNKETTQSIPSYYKQLFPKAELQKAFAYNSDSLPKFPQQFVGWAIIPPQQ